MGPRHWIRDENGWLIPRDGTISRQIYDLLKAGKSRADIVKAFPSSKVWNIDNKICHIKNPDTFNAQQRARYSRKPPRVIVDPVFRRRAHRIAKLFGLKVAFDWTGAMKVISFPQSVRL